MVRLCVQWCGDVEVGRWSLTGQPAWCLHDAGMKEGAYWASIDCSGAPSEETSSRAGGQSVCLLVFSQ